MSDILTQEPKYYRSSVAVGFRKLKEGVARVDPKGGRYGAGIIRGASLIAVGEALGHEAWVDEVFLNQVADSFKSGKGIKVRYTHPSMSGDGLATHIGRVFNAKVVGDSVAGDVHFIRAGRRGPDGDLGGHVMDLAQETPEDFGMSIVFDPDLDAELDFASDNTRFASENTRGDGSSIQFVSPDERNENNYPHVRLKKLWAADFVGDPAANEHGVFYGRGQELPVELDAMLSYAIGISDKPSTCSAFSNVSPERAKGFVSRFLNSHGLEIVEKNAMSKDTKSASPEADKPVETPVKAAAAPVEDPNVQRSPDGLGATKPGDCGNGFASKPATRDELEKAFFRDADSDSRKAFAKEFCKEAMYNGLTLEEARTEFTAALLDRLEKAEQLASAGSVEGEDTPIQGTTASVDLSRKGMSPSQKLAAIRN